MRISDWSSDVCSSDLPPAGRWARGAWRSGPPEPPAWWRALWATASGGSLCLLRHEGSGSGRAPFLAAPAAAAHPLAGPARREPLLALQAPPPLGLAVLAGGRLGDGAGHGLTTSRTSMPYIALTSFFFSL